MSVPLWKIEPLWKVVQDVRDGKYVDVTLNYEIPVSELTPIDFSGVEAEITIRNNQIMYAHIKKIKTEQCS